MARGTRIRLVLAFPLVAALILTGCGVLGSNGNGTVCPAPTLEPVAAPSAGGGSVTYGFLIDRAYTGDAKRSPSYPWPQLPKTALDTLATSLGKLELRPGDSVFGAWISHNSNDMREIFLPLTQVPKTATQELPAPPAQPYAADPRGSGRRAARGSTRPSLPADTGRPRRSARSRRCAQCARGSARHPQRSPCRSGRHRASCRRQRRRRSRCRPRRARALRLRRRACGRRPPPSAYRSPGVTKSGCGPAPSAGSSRSQGS